MKKLWVLIRKEYKQVVGSKGFVIGTLLTPLFLGAMLFLPAILAQRGETKTSAVGILEIGTQRIHPLVTRLATDTLPSGAPRWDFQYESRPVTDTAAIMDDWRQACLDNRLEAFLVIDSTIWTGADVPFFATNVSRLNLFRDLRSELSDFVISQRLADAGLDPELTRALTVRVDLEPVKIGATGESKADFLSDYFGGLLFAMIMMMMIIGYGNMLMRSVIDEKNSRIVEVMVSSVTAGQIMLSKIVGLGAATLSQVALWVLMGAVMASQGVAARYIGGAAAIFSSSFAAWFVVFLILGFLLYSCFFALIGAVVPTEQDAQQFVFPITMSLILPVLIEFAIIDDPNATWVRILSFLPPVSPGIMLMRNVFSQIPIWEPLLSAVILAISVLGVAWFSGRVFRIGILMTGKRPTLPEIMKWVRYT